jgi:hypothetical protein
MTTQLRLHQFSLSSRWAVALICATFAALFYIFCMANGMVVGDLIGLPGRERQIALAHHRASMWLDASVIFEVGAALAVFSLLKIGSESDPLARFVARGVTAVFSSLAATLLMGIVIFLVLR